MGREVGPTSQPPSTTVTPLTLRHSRESGNPGMGREVRPPPLTPTPCQSPQTTVQSFYVNSNLYSHQHRESRTITPYSHSQAQTPTLPPTHRHSRSHRHSRESGNPGMCRTWGIPAPAEPPKLPKSTGNYRKLPALAIFPTRRIPSKSPETRPATVIPAPSPSPPPTSVIPAKAGIQGWAGRGAFPAQANPPKLPRTTENYRKLPALAIFPTRWIPSKSPESRPLTVIPAPSPSFPRKRESRDGPGCGASLLLTAHPPNHPKLPKNTGNYRKLPALAIFPHSTNTKLNR